MKLSGSIHKKDNFSLTIQYIKQTPHHTSFEVYRNLVLKSLDLPVYHSLFNKLIDTYNTQILLNIYVI